MASEDFANDELAYLQPGFDASTLKVAQLRNVLLTHGVSYPSSAKKAELVEIFNSGLKPKAKKILSDLRKIQRSSTGIEDAASSLASTQDEEETPEPPPTTRRGRGRGRPKKNEAEEDIDETVVAPPTVSRRRTPAPSKTPQPEATIERKPSRRVTSTPAVKKEPREPEIWIDDAKESPFSTDNPFQSGSSPPAPSTLRRKSQRPSTGEEKRRKSVSRKSGESSSNAITRKAAVHVPIGGVDYDNDGIDAGEDFAPEEQRALEKARRDGTAVVPVRRQARRRPGAAPITSFLLSTLIAIGASSTFLFAREKFEVGYCGVGRPSENIAGIEVPEWAEALRPQCEECPRHARCYPQLKTQCEDNFVLRHHPLSLNGLLPIPPTCEPDSDKEKRIKSVANHMVNTLRSATAEAECEGTGSSAEVTEEVLRSEIKSKMKKNVSPDEVETLLTQAIADVQGRDEITVTVNETTNERKFTSSSLANIGISCAARRYLRRTVEQYTRQVLMLLAALAVAMVAVYQHRDNQTTKREAKQLATKVFESLADYATDLIYDSSAHRDGYLSVTQLRDDVLRNEFSASKRKKLWKHVEKLVEQNSNVRAKVGALDSGDVGRGWKWIGAVKAIDDSGSISRPSSRRQSGRYSFPAMASSSPQMSELGTYANGTPKQEGDDSFTRWDNTNRPQF